MKWTAASLLTLTVTLYCAGGVQAQPRCEAPQVLISIDKSSSMLGGIGGGLTKWGAARMAIEEMTMTFAERVHFGLQVFPFPDRCAPGEVTIDIGANGAETLIAGLGEPPPSGGNWTPMAETLNVAAALPALSDATRDNHLVLITDGWQWCDPYDPATRFTPVEAVTALRGLGVTVHIVGFGAGVDALTLNRAAVAAGTELPGCDVEASDPAAPNHCYQQADDMAELRAVLDAIGREITDELCDGFDNDCDGMVDEDYDQDMDGYTSCGTDDTMPGVTIPELADCEDLVAEINPGREEICDGVDNNCDDLIDPGCSCTNGETRPCGSDIGLCTRGNQVCVEGAWGDCSGGTGPVGESCDASDDDCDGVVDEGVLCPDGLTCQMGECVDLTEPGDTVMPPPETNNPPGSPATAGCACAVVGQQESGLAWPFGLAFGLVVLARSRRRRNG